MFLKEIFFLQLDCCLERYTVSYLKTTTRPSWRSRVPLSVFCFQSTRDSRGSGPDACCEVPLALQSVLFWMREAVCEVCGKNVRTQWAGGKKTQLNFAYFRISKVTKAWHKWALSTNTTQWPAWMFDVWLHLVRCRKRSWAGLKNPLAAQTSDEPSI